MLVYVVCDLLCDAVWSALGACFCVFVCFVQDVVVCLVCGLLCGVVNVFLMCCLFVCVCWKVSV